MKKEPHSGVRGLGKLEFSPRKYEIAARHHDRNWSLHNGILYCICQCFPDHRQRVAVYAKLNIIGRSYATGIERQIKNKGRHQGGAMERLAEHFWKNRRPVDAIIATLHGVKEPLDEPTLSKVLAAHGKLLRLTKKIVRAGETPRSFVSKYLHFHCQAVPIFDSFAARALTTLYREPRKIRRFSPRGPVDSIYKQFLGRFWLCYDDARDAGAKVSVKRLDRYLVDLLKTKHGKKRFRRPRSSSTATSQSGRQVSSQS